MRLRKCVWIDGWMEVSSVRVALSVLCVWLLIPERKLCVYMCVIGRKRKPIFAADRKLANQGRRNALVRSRVRTIC